MVAVIPLLQRSMMLGLAPTAVPLMMPPSHSLQPIEHPTPIQRQVCPMSQMSVPFRQAQARLSTFQRSSQVEGAGDVPPAQRSRGSHLRHVVRRETEQLGPRARCAAPMGYSIEPSAENKQST